MITWMSVAAGLIGIEDDDPANMMYAGVLAIGLVGAFIARFKARGLARALFATALAQAVVGAVRRLGAVVPACGAGAIHREGPRSKMRPALTAARLPLHLSTRRFS
jgi:hypothetical protein